MIEYDRMNRTSLIMYLRYGLVQPQTAGMVGGTLQVAKALIGIYIPGFPKRKAQKNPQIHQYPPIAICELILNCKFVPA